MASVVAPGGRSTGGRKILNTELNLVPFIDLLTCLICFLLMTAVWVSLGKISVSSPGQGPETQEPNPIHRLNLVVAITPQGYLVSGNGQTLEGGDILRQGDNYDLGRLGEKLREVNGAYPDKTDIVVMSEDGIRYRDLVDTLDVCVANNFPNISVSGTI
jgi:biopolymer transport protein ExbD